MFSIENKKNHKTKFLSKFKLLVLKKNLPYIAIFIILIGIFFPIQITHAAVSDWLPSWSKGLFPSVTDFALGLASEAAFALLKFLSWFMWFAGSILNYILKYTIMNMKLHLDQLTGINTAWKVIKDLMNIVFIFMLVYEGILIIIDQSRSNIKSIITGIVLSALLINFSLFFTKILIDASNIVTIGMYQTITGTTGDETLDGGLSDTIVADLRLTDIYGKDMANMFTGKDFGGVVISFFLSGLLIVVATFVFFAVAVIFMIRYIVLVILLTLSPIAFMGLGIPQMRSYAKQWWTSLTGQLLFGPIYMIMTWVILVLMASPGFITTRYSYYNLIAEKPSFSSFGLIFNYAMLISLLIASLVIAKQTASQGSKYIGTATKGLTAFAGGAVMGGVGYVGRRTAGAYADRKANDQELKDRAAGTAKNKDGTAMSTAQILRAQATLGAYRKAASSSFDSRAIANTFGIDLGKGTKGVPFMGNEKAGQGGYRKMAEDKAKAEKEYAESLKMSDAEKERRQQAVDAHKATEEAERAARFDNNAAKQAELAENKRPHVETINNINTQITENQKEIDNVKKDIDKTDQRIKDLNSQLETEVDMNKQKEIKQKIENEKALKNSLNNKVDDATKTIDKRRGEISAANNKIKAIQDDFNAEKNSWMSDTMKDLVGQAGGQKEETVNGRVVKIAVDDQVKKRNDAVMEARIAELGRRAEVVNQTTEAYAGLDEKIVAGLKRFGYRTIYGNANYNLEAAAKVRGATKKKSAKELIDEALKTGETSDAIAAAGAAAAPAPAAEPAAAAAPATPTPPAGTA